MKKFLAACLIVIMCGSMAACSLFNNSGDSLESFIESSVFQEQVKTYKEMYSDTMDVDVIAEGDSLVYLYTLKEQYDEKEAALFKSTMEASESSMESAMLEVIDSIKETVKVDNPAVIVRFCNADDTVIYEKTYTK